MLLRGFIWNGPPPVRIVVLATEPLKPGHAPIVQCDAGRCIESCKPAYMLPVAPSFRGGAETGVYTQSIFNPSAPGKAADLYNKGLVSKVLVSRRCPGTEAGASLPASTLT